VVDARVGRAGLKVLVKLELYKDLPACAKYISIVLDAMPGKKTRFRSSLFFTHSARPSPAAS
jgi:hypothetical protein